MLDYMVDVWGNLCFPNRHGELLDRTLEFLTATEGNTRVDISLDVLVVLVVLLELIWAVTVFLSQGEFINLNGIGQYLERRHYHTGLSIRSFI